MRKAALLIGNDINNIDNSKSWSDLVNALKEKVELGNEGEDITNQFPLRFENILNHGLLNNRIESDQELKEIIKEKIKALKRHDLLNRISEIDPEHIITTNYDFLLENSSIPTNDSIVKEQKYSIFRKYAVNGRNFWHIHGDSINARSINLGYEHYCGQLQMMRNFALNRFDYKHVEDLPKESLVNRIKKENSRIFSWIDLFFFNDIHIFALSLDFIEIDLWWLLTYRAKQKHEHHKKITNRIIYYIPRKYMNNVYGKLQLMRNLGMEVVGLENEKQTYYENVFDYISNTINNPHSTS